MRVKLFVKDACPRCPAAKRVCEDIETLEIYDVGDIDGLAEASFYSVLATPSIVIVDSAGTEVASWRGEVPTRSDISAHLAC